MKMTRRAMLLGGSALCLSAMQPFEAAAEGGLIYACGLGALATGESGVP